MTRRIAPNAIIDHLTKAGHHDFHVREDSPRTCRVIHDGPDEAAHLTAYAQVLRSHGYTVTPQAATNIRPNRLKVTHP
ncbi:hypothetical protein [Streptomyces sp. CBMA152]|uniref:hypothetical protein n=1 Tax=Streptomyces sp. CBMA152 TaxID=1896312 RepID=UPI001660967B|nr:hypothetical protein [Streptomyces sp. CBMA152]MBD0743536.1 hypothetical protein [Streptomyces sp. CBMA152]